MGDILDMEVYRQKLKNKKTNLSPFSEGMDAYWKNYFDTLKAEHEKNMAKNKPTEP